MMTEEKRKQVREARLEREARELQEATRTEITEEDIRPIRPFRGPEVAAEFDRQHGSDGINIEGEVFYSDGSRADVNPMGAMRPPPEDDFKRLSNIVLYWQTLVDDAVAQFDHEKAGIRMVQRHGGTPDNPDAALAKLTRLQKIVEARRERLNAAKEALEETHTWRIRHDSRKQTESESNEHFWQKVNSIEV